MRYDTCLLKRKVNLLKIYLLRNVEIYNYIVICVVNIIYKYHNIGKIKIAIFLFMHNKKIFFYRGLISTYLQSEMCDCIRI